MELRDEKRLSESEDQHAVLHVSRPQNKTFQHADRRIYDQEKQAWIQYRKKYPYCKFGYDVFGLKENERPPFIEGGIDL